MSVFIYEWALWMSIHDKGIAISFFRLGPDPAPHRDPMPRVANPLGSDWWSLSIWAHHPPYPSFSLDVSVLLFSVAQVRVAPKPCRWFQCMPVIQHLTGQGRKILKSRSWSGCCCQAWWLISGTHLLEESEPQVVLVYSQVLRVCVCVYVCVYRFLQSTYAHTFTEYTHHTQTHRVLTYTQMHS